ncbi:hypothetical protein DRP07_00255 [Archaeoglobales archaeon]|nr:MAG: hypothetical protein DRP07_00255 [Archaeoglobales archaeon]
MGMRIGKLWVLVGLVVLAGIAIAASSVVHIDKQITYNGDLLFDLETQEINVTKLTSPQVTWNFSAGDAPTSAATVIVSKEGSYTVARWYNGTVLAKGTDSASVIQTTIDTISNGTVLLKCGVYNNLGSNLNLNDNIAFVGEDSFCTVLSFTSGNQLLAGNNNYIGDLTFDGGDPGPSGIVEINNKENVIVESVRILNILNVTDGWSSAIHITHNSRNITVRDFYINNCDRGVEVENGANKVIVEDGYISNVLAGGTSPLYAITAHGHITEGYAHDVIFRNIFLSNSAGFGTSTKSVNIIFDGIIVKNSTKFSFLSNSFQIVTNCIFDGTSGDTLLTINGGAVISNSKFINSTGFFAIKVDSGTVFISNIEVSPSLSSPSNYGLRINGGYVSVVNSYFHGLFNNYAIHVNGGTLDLYNSKIEDKGLSLDTSGNRIYGNDIESGVTIYDSGGNFFKNNAGYHYTSQFDFPTSAPSSPQTGDAYFDAATNTLYIYNGTAWVAK